MSRRSFDTLITITDSNSDVVDTGNPASDSLIKAAEEFLGLEFPDDYKVFLKTWGTLSVGPVEYYGIAGSDFQNSRIPNGIWFTSVKRDQLGLPNNLIVLCDNGDEYICIEIDKKNKLSIVVWDVSARELVRVKSNDLFDFIIEDSEAFL